MSTLPPSARRATSAPNSAVRQPDPTETTPLPVRRVLDRITHHTRDEVEFWYLDSLVAPYGFVIEQRRADAGLASDGSALLIHADSWWDSPAERQAGIDELLDLNLRVPVAVHGYHLTDDQLQQLRDHGLLCSAALNQELIDALAQAREA